MPNDTLNWSKWLLEARFSYMTEEQKQQSIRWLLSVRNAVLHNAGIKPSNTIIDIGTGTGLLGFGALDFIDNTGKVIFSDYAKDCLDTCKQVAEKLNTDKKIEFLLSDCLNIKLGANTVDRALMRSVLVHILDKERAISEIYRILKPEGIFSAFEPVIRSNTRCAELVNPEDLTDYTEFKQAEDECMDSMDNPLTNFDENTIKELLNKTGFSDGIIDKQIVETKYEVKKGMVKSWLTTPPSPGTKTMKEKFLMYFEEPKIDRYIEELQKALENRSVTIKSNVLYIKAKK